MADIYYLPGTKIGTVRTPAQSKDFALGISDAAGQPLNGGQYTEIIYPASIAPFSTGGLSDPTWNDSVAAGVVALTTANPQPGDTVTGYSQGAVVATEYKRAHPNSGINYVLVENPNRPNGGVLERFNGLTVPILNITFNGATPVESSSSTGKTVDISRQYDGWSDFPAYPLNVLADANAIAGIYYLHGSTQDLGPGALNGLSTKGNDYYQVHGDTTYYLIPTDELPILMPFNGIVPDPVLKALDPPLRYLIELGYDRSNYSTPTPAGLFPTNVDPLTVATGLAGATVQGLEIGLGSSGAAAPSFGTAKAPSASNALDSGITNALPKLDVPKLDVPKLDVPKLDAPKLDVPKLDVPKLDATKLDATKLDVPKLDVPKLDAPKLDLPKLNPPKPPATNSPLSSTLTSPKPIKKASDASPVKSIQSAVNSITKNLAPKPKAKPAADNSSPKE